MTFFPEYHKYDGLGLAELVRTKQISSAELVEEAIRRIEAHKLLMQRIQSKIVNITLW